MKTIFWDYDGVIVDSWHVAFELWKEILAKYGVELKVEAAQGLFKGYAWKDLTKLGAKESDKHLYSQQEVEVYKAPETAPKTFPLMPEILKACADKYQQFVITNNQTQVVIDDLKKHKLNQLIIETQGREFPGDKADRIAALEQKHNLDLTQSVLVTDTVGDIIQARKAGIKVIAVTWGFHDATVLRDHTPDQLFDTPESLLKFLTS